MEDHAPTYESERRCSMMQLLESQPLYDWFVAAYQNTSWSARKIEPFNRKNHIDIRVRVRELRLIRRVL